MNVNDFFCLRVTDGVNNLYGGVKVGVFEIVMGIIVIVMAVAITAMVLLQSGKDKRLSGAIAGAAETFFAKGKSKTRDKMLAKFTTVLSFVFVIIVVVLYIVMA